MRDGRRHIKDGSTEGGEVTDRGTITVNQLRVDDGMEGWGSETAGCGGGRGTIYLDLKGEELG